jgi:hypothetical protein
MNTDKVKETVRGVVEHAEKIVEHGKKLAENPKAIGIAIGEAMNKLKGCAGSFRAFGEFGKSFAKSVVEGYKEARREVPNEPGHIPEQR